MSKAIPEPQPTVIMQRWLESEKGWGKRPDGVTLHPSEVSRKAFIEAHWEADPEELPDTYSRPIGDPERVEVTRETYDEVHTAEKGGIWVLQTKLKDYGFIY